MLCKPLFPGRPPGTVLYLRPGHPTVRIEIFVIGAFCRHLKRAAGVPGLADDPRVMAPAGQQKSNLRIREQMYLVDGLPWCHVIAHRGYTKYRRPYVADR